ncbi:MAG: hypothetical protein JHC73_19975 [Dolichospermum sp.]|nr:hypothetical protein [Dolichospermum sp.]
MQQVKVNLNETQRKKLKRAIDEGKDFSAKLSHANLDGNDAIMTGKVLYNKIGKNKIAGKGMVIKLSSNQVAQLKKKTKDIPPSLSPVKTKRGGAIAITTATVFAALGMAKEFVDDHPAVVQFLSNIAEDISYLLNNPMAISFRFIATVRIPNLNKRYRDIVIDIDRTKKIIATLTNQAMIKRHQRRIINLETLRDRVGNHIETLIERLPMIKQMAEERDETIKARQAAQIEKDLKKEMKELEEAKQKFDALKGSGLQVEPYYGNGVVMDKIKERVKKNHIEPFIENQKKKLDIEVEKAKKKAETEVKNKIKSEINKQKSKIPLLVGQGLQVEGRGKKK